MKTITVKLTESEAKATRDALDNSAHEYENHPDGVGDDLTLRQRKRRVLNLNRVVAKIDLKI